MVANALSRKAVSMGSLAFIPIACVVSRFSLYDRIRERQYDDPHLFVLKGTVQHGNTKDVTIGDDVVLRMQGWICLPNVDRLRELILEEAHNSQYSIHPGFAKMYQDLRQHYWWRNMKKDIVGFVAQFLNYFGGSWDQFLPLAEFAYNNNYQSSIQMASCEALYGRWYWSPVGRFEPAQSRQKSYADRKVREVAYMVGEKVLLRISPMKGVMRFRKKAKLSPWFIGPIEILKRIGEVAYELALPPSLSGVHLVFHVSMLRKYVGDLSHVLDFSTLQLDSDKTYSVESMAILDRQVRKLRSKNISSLKVQWRGQVVGEARWETEREMRSKYPQF
ncbi:uncharacterized protein [Nicotiana sylvestris]|uniref:uncharacterized protein n=1 Tax=Nicotiana sylvestris TaxID=4096 RepID=UPI00388CB854